MEPDPTGEEGQHEQRCNKDQKSKAFQAKQDEVSGMEFKRSCDRGVLTRLLLQKEAREFEQKAAKEAKIWTETRSRVIRLLCDGRDALLDALPRDPALRVRHAFLRE